MNLRQIRNLQQVALLTFEPPPAREARLKRSPTLRAASQLPIPFTTQQGAFSSRLHVMMVKMTNDNDYWILKPARGNVEHGAMVVDGMPKRLEQEHVLSQQSLHSHRIIAHVAGGDHHEASCCKVGEEGDDNDLFRIEFVPSARVRLVLINTNCALHYCITV